MTLAEFILSILSGGGSYAVSYWLYRNVVPGDWSSQAKRLVAYIISFGLAALAIALGDYFNIAQATQDTVWTAMVTAFATATALHGLIELPGA